MQQDRKAIVEIISLMLDNPDEHGIYPTSTCYTNLEMYCEEIRLQAMGWAYACACSLLDKGDDPRLVEVPEILKKAQKDLQ